MKDNELQIIEQLTGVSPNQIKLADDGFWSRGYVIDNGRIVFKFKKSPEVSYKPEIKALEFINSLNLNINTQKVGWISPDDSYLGIYGVIGRPLETMSNPDYQNIGEQLAIFLQKLHQAHPEDAEVFTLDKELTAWQERYQKSHDKLADYFSKEEISRFDKLVFEIIPAKLQKLGENIVYSHGDLGGGNIFIGNKGRVGIIDFSEMCYFDEAGDFMDVSSEELRAAMLDAYKADEILREKVKLRVLVRPLIVFGDYARRGDTKQVEQLITKIKELLEQL